MVWTLRGEKMGGSWATASCDPPRDLDAVSLRLWIGWKITWESEGLCKNEGRNPEYIWYIWYFHFFVSTCHWYNNAKIIWCACSKPRICIATPNVKRFTPLAGATRPPPSYLPPHTHHTHKPSRSNANHTLTRSLDTLIFETSLAWTGDHILIKKVCSKIILSFKLKIRDTKEEIYFCECADPSHLRMVGVVL